MSKQPKITTTGTVEKRGSYVGKRNDFLFFGFPINRKWYGWFKWISRIAIGIIIFFTGLAVINFLLDIVISLTLLGLDTIDVLSMQTFPNLIFWIILLVFVAIIKMNIKE